ncbi:MAG: PPC domain-containing protein [Deltaproteobacteria bacterium]|nr:PPC domain-containing protein [Deltaproteobacteria bacterium]
MRVWTAALLCTALLAFGLAGCNGDTEDPCAGLANLCTEDGALQCNTGDTAIQTCQANADNCLVWTDTETCGARQTCDDSGEAPACVCNDTCTTAGETQCAGTVIQTCTADGDGCLGWANTTDCADTNQACDDSGADAVCVGGGCTDGETRCDGDVVQTCADGAWGDTQDCAATGQTCDDSGADAVCVGETCTNGETRCDGNVVQTCTDHAWVDTEDCETSGQVCDDSGADAICVVVCTHECDTVGDTQCNGEVIELCTTDADGCRYWSVSRDCGSSGQTCDDSAEPAVCTGTCVSNCTVLNETHCNGTLIETCLEPEAGCLIWMPTLDCAMTDEICDDSGANAVCVYVCDHECDTAGETRCFDNIVQTCTTDEHACRLWEDTEDCDDTSTFCDDSGADAVCTANCVSDCAGQGGETQCNGSVIETCTEVFTDCFQWVGGQDCADLDQDCDDSGADAVCVTSQPQPVGAPCDDDDDCESGICFFEVLYGFPQGYCVAECTGDDPYGCADPTAVCVDVGAYICFDLCDPANPVCREGYFCYDFGGGVGTCWPGCDDDGQCTATDHCDMDSGFCDCPDGLHADEDLMDCVYDDCDWLDCLNLNMTCDETGGCGGACAACDACIDAGYTQSVNHCYPPGAVWGGECEIDADCPGTGMPGADTFCDGSTSGHCSQWNGPDFVTEGEPCAGDPDSVGFIYQDPWSGSTYNICYMSCSDDGDCRPGYACSDGWGTSGDISICMAIDDCETSGCNDLLGVLYCDTDSGYCWEDACAADPCAGMPNSTGTCIPAGDEFTCECSTGYYWNPDNGACELFVCGAAILTTAGASDDTCNGTQIYNAGNNPGGSCTGYGTSGQEIVYELAVPADMVANIGMTPNGFDAALWATTDCADLDGLLCVEGSDSGDPEQITITNDTGADATYYVIADGYSGCGEFELTVAFSASPCAGDPCGSVANATGECVVDGDEYICVCDTGYQWNPGTLTCDAMTVDTLPMPGSVDGTIAVGDEIDWYVFDITAPGAWYFETSDPGTGTQLDDTQIWLCDYLGCTYGYSGDNLEYDDDGGDDAYSLIYYDFVSAGTYYIGVQSYSTGTGDYTLTSYQDPCSADPCAGVANSTGECVNMGSGEYACVCDSGYEWNPGNMACEAISGTPLPLPGSIEGEFLTPEQIDWYVIDVTTPGTWTFETSDGSTGTPVDDTQLWLCDYLGCVYSDVDNLDYNDDIDYSGGNYYSLITYDFTSAGTYYLGVQSFYNYYTGTYAITSY